MKLDALSPLLGSEARARLLAHFTVHPESRLHVRALERHTGIGKGSLQAELKRLEEMGLVRRERDGRRIVYARTGYGREWTAIDTLVSAYAPGLLIRDALAAVPGVEAAFIFGSVAKGNERNDSDIDLFVYGAHMDDAAMARAISDLSLVMDWRVDWKLYDRPRFLSDVRAGASFLPKALVGPRIWLIGSDADLPRQRQAAA